MRRTPLLALVVAVLGGAWACDRADLRERTEGTASASQSAAEAEASSGSYLFTNVWIRRDGKWQAVASHGSRIR